LISRPRKVVLIILDGVGIGALPDAAEYGDQGSNTLGNLAHSVGGLEIPNLQRAGLGNIAPVEGVPPRSEPMANFGKMAEASPGKDSISGHWEIAGLILERPFPTYPEGFPPEVIEPFEKAVGKSVLGNKPASGTEIIKELGDEHIRTGRPIVYTSADSVFQIAAHLDVIPLEELYRISRIAREQLVGEHAVGRVIARPFKGPSGAFERTADRKDFSLCPPGSTLVDKLKERGLKTVSVGKVDHLFGKRGFTDMIKTRSNSEGIARIVEQAKGDLEGLVFANLVDFDMLWGHRNNPEGFRESLEEFDRALPEIIEPLRHGDILVITADHGNDPTTPSTDHSREYVPLLVYGKNLKSGVDLGTRTTFADLGATIGEVFGVVTEYGTSFLREISHG
jgi:phosphopentomutase